MYPSSGSTKGSADFLILRRRRVEERQRNHEEAVAAASTLHQKACWEEKRLGSIAQTVQQKEEREKQQGRLAAALKTRSDRLAELLSGDSQLLTAESKQGQLDKIQQRRQDLERRARELKEKREALREKFVEEKYYQRWHDSVDELRTANSKLMELEAAATRCQQQREKQAALTQVREEEQFFNKLWHKSYDEKVKKELIDEKQTKRKNFETKLTLEDQVAQRRREKEEERIRSTDEAEELRALMQQEAEVEQRKRVEEKEKTVSRRREMDSNLLQERERKASERQKQKEEESRVVEELTVRENDLLEKEKQNKLRCKIANSSFVLAAREERDFQNEERAQLQRLILEEQEKMWEKQEQKREAEELVRRNMMKEVELSRAEQIARKAQMTESAKKEQLLQRDRNEKAAACFKKEDSERAEADSHRMKEHEDVLRQQIGAKQAAYYRQVQQAELQVQQEKRQQRTFDSALQEEQEKQAKLRNALQGHIRKQRQGGGLILG